MDIEHITLVFLICLFLIAEVYRALRSARGEIISFEDSEFGFLMSPSLMAKVKLSDGSVVTASVNGCVACMGRLGVGTQVRVYNSSEGYVVDTPWFHKKMKDTCSLARK